MLQKLLCAGVATSSSERVVVVDLVVAVTLDASRRNIGLLHAVQSGPGGVLLGADLVVEAGIGRAGVEAALGDVLAVRLARVLDDLS